MASSCWFPLLRGSPWWVLGECLLGTGTNACGPALRHSRHWFPEGQCESQFQNVVAPSQTTYRMETWRRHEGYLKSTWHESKVSMVRHHTLCCIYFRDYKFWRAALNKLYTDWCLTGKRKITDRNFCWTFLKRQVITSKHRLFKKKEKDRLSISWLW